MQPANLRPMELGDILDGAFKIYRARFAPMFLSALLPYLPMVLASAVLGLGARTGGDAMTLAGGVGMLASLPFMLFGFLLSWGSLTYIVSETYLGRPADLEAGMRHAFSRALPLAGAVIMAAILAGLGFILCVVPGFIAMLMFFAVVPAVVLERRGASEALGRSRELSRGALGTVFVVVFIAGIIASLPGYALSVLSIASDLAGPPSLTLQIGVLLLRLLLSALATPFSTAATVLLYYDRRIRTEALDVQLAAEALPG